MGRPPNPEARAALLHQAAAYVLQHGLNGLSLRPLASALGVSARLLLYHFGSKEHLVTEVLATVATQQQILLGSLEAGTDPLARFDALWERLTSPEFMPFLRSLFEVELRAMDGDGAYRQFARGTMQAWLGLVTSHLAAPTPAAANFVLAALTGLLLDRFSTRDDERTQLAFEALRDALHAGDFL